MKSWRTGRGEEEEEEGVEDEEEQEVMVSHQTADGAETRPEVGVTTRSLVWSNEGREGGADLSLAASW